MTPRHLLASYGFSKAQLIVYVSAAPALAYREEMSNYEKKKFPIISL